MASEAAALAEEVFARANDLPFDVATDKFHVRGVASLAAGFDIVFWKQWPQPVLVGAMRFFDASGCAAIALMARRAAEFFRIVRFQKFWLRMTGEGVRVLVRLLPP